jgi:acyl-CoA synthetase (AMP-forming)/AMP-acid ligase II
VAASAVAVPLNPAYEAFELDRYFAALRPRALITTPGFAVAARQVALARGIAVLDLQAGMAEAGLFTLVGGTGVGETGVGEAGAGEAGKTGAGATVTPEDVMLLLLTSGTTAEAKIVPLTHGNIATSAASSGAALALRESDRCLNVLPLFHGHGLIATVLTSLAAGAGVVATPGCDVTRFFSWLDEFQPSWYSAVPTMHQAILAEARRRGARPASRLRFVRSASASLPAGVFAELERVFGAPVIEFYGMTETASAPVACNPLPPGRRKPGSVGLPVDLDMAITDSRGIVLPRGQTGMVTVRGKSVMAGYDGDPVTSRVAFAGDWFRTRDLGYVDADGYLFLTGRREEMINRGGEKIAPRQVDEALLEHPAVAEAVTFAVPHPTLGEDVGAAVVLRPAATALPQEIRQFVMGRLAGFKVPRHVVVVEALPRGATGKVQRGELATLLGLTDAAGGAAGFVAARTLLEKVLAERWAEILKLERIGIDDDFFAAGGDSLQVAHVLSHLHEITRLEIAVARFFAAPTIRATAAYLEPLIRAGQAAMPAAPIGPAPRETAMPASIVQEQLWRLQRALRGAPFLNVFCPLRLSAVVDRAILQQSLAALVGRHEILRTGFADAAGRCVQLIAPDVDVTLAFDDLASLPEPDREAVGERLIREAALHRFDLAQAPLLRARLLRLAEDEHLLLLTLHGIIADAWSVGLLVDELFALYDAFAAAAPSPLAPPPLHYADVAHWQRGWRSRPEIAAQLDYWREQLRGLPPAGPAAPPPEPVDRFRTERRAVALPASLTEAARRFALGEGGTLYMALVAALNIVLGRRLGQDEVSVMTLVANRHRPGTDRLLGPLANTVILRTDLAGDPTAREVVRRVRATTLAAFAHQDIPFEAVIDALAREGGLEPNALPRVMIGLHNAALRPATGRRLRVAEASPSLGGSLVTATTFDINLMLREGGPGITGSCIYKPYRWEAEAVDDLVRDFRELLQDMVAAPDRPLSALGVLRSGMTT